MDLDFFVAVFMVAQVIINMLTLSAWRRHREDHRRGW